MSSGIPVHGNPEGQVYGLLGQVVGADNGIVYSKVLRDTRNDGWEVLQLPTPTPTPVPTATPVPTPSPTPGPTPTPGPSPTPTPTSAGPFYQLTVNGNTGIAYTLGSGLYAVGAQPTVGAGLSGGFVFDHWSGDVGYLLGSINSNPNIINMPPLNISITPNATSATTYHLTINTGQLGMFDFEPLVRDYVAGSLVNISVQLFSDWYFTIWTDVDPALLNHSKFINPNSFTMQSSAVRITKISTYLIISGSDGQTSVASPFTMSAHLTSSISTGSFSIEMRFTSSASPANTASWYDTGSWFLVPPPTGSWSTVTASLISRPDAPAAFRITGSMSTVFDPSVSGSGYYQFRVGIFETKPNIDEVGSYLTSSIIQLS